MIDKETLDELVEVPEIEDLKSEIQESLTEEGFAVNSFKSGGIFMMIIMIFIQIYIELLNLARTLICNSTITNSSEKWLELKAKDFSKNRKEETYTEGYITLKREDSEQNIVIAQGHIFKTEANRSGEEYRYIVQEKTIFEKESNKLKVLVKAEYPGKEYNLAKNTITKSLTHIETVTEITNEEDWITSEGSDIEEVESFRKRVLNSWSELSTNVIAAKYKNVAESVPGVLYAQIDDDHPRGQGTVDIIITSTAGQATETLIEKVGIAVEEIRGPYDNLLVKSSEIIYQDIELILEINSCESSEGLEEKVSKAIKEFMEVNSTRELNSLYISDINQIVRNAVSIRNAKIVTPTEDIELGIEKVIMLGNTTTSIRRI